MRGLAIMGLVASFGLGSAVGWAGWHMDGATDQCGQCSGGTGGTYAECGQCSPRIWLPIGCTQCCMPNGGQCDKKDGAGVVIDPPPQPG